MVGDAAREAKITSVPMTAVPGDGAYVQRRQLGEMPRNISVLVMAAG